MRESDIERFLRLAVQSAGGVAYKFVSPGHVGVPDRLVCWPNGIAEFVETKRPGEVPRPDQLREHERLRALGFVVVVIDSKSGAHTFVEKR